jgi:hypothetical protein
MGHMYGDAVDINRALGTPSEDQAAPGEMSVATRGPLRTRRTLSTDSSLGRDGIIEAVAISTEELLVAVERARAAAEAAGELRPAHIGPVRSSFPESLRIAAGEDLASGAYHQAAEEAVAGDPDLVQG